VYYPCMATKTISLREEAYERLRRAKRGPAESFSDVVMRAVWLDQPTTAGEFLRAARERGPMYSAEELDRIEVASGDDAPPADKWTRG
jgi:predicted CopG family antitoxin